MSRPPHPPWFNHPNNIRWRTQAVKFIIMQFSPLSIFLSFISKYPPQHSVLKNHQSVVLPQSERPSFAPIQHNWHLSMLQKWKSLSQLLMSKFHVFKSLSANCSISEILRHYWILHYKKISPCFNRPNLIAASRFFACTSPPPPLWTSIFPLSHFLLCSWGYLVPFILSRPPV
jgi:hypothetical protein